MGKILTVWLGKEFLSGFLSHSEIHLFSVMMVDVCAFASLCLFEYGSDKFEGSLVYFLLLELSVFHILLS